METTDKIWFDGKLVPWKDAHIHVISHALHYGSSVFEGIRCYKTKKGPAIFRLKDHVKRLFNSAKTLDMEIPFSENEVEEAIIETVSVNNLQACYIRPLVFYGYGKMGLNPSGAPVQIMIAAWPWGSYLGDSAVTVKTSSIMRVHPKSFDPEAKVGGVYVNSIRASLEAKKAGFDEALLLDYEGHVAEGPGENIFFVRNGKIATPTKGTILSGITRNSIMTIAKDAGIEVEEKTITLEDVKKADEAIFTGTAAEVTVIGSIDNTTIGTGDYPIAKKIQKMYLDIVQGKNPKYDKWLTYC